MLSPHPADPTLTTDNLMKVVKEVEHRWEELGHELELQLQLSGVHGMAGVVDEYVSRYPTPSWKNVATALQEMKLDKLADEVTTKYVRGMDVNHATCLIQKLYVRGRDIADEGVEVHIVCIVCMYGMCDTKD